MGVGVGGMKEMVWCTCIMSYSGDRIVLCLIGLKIFFLQLCYKIIININLQDSQYSRCRKHFMDGRSEGV